jgi:hypothetical protein
MGRKVAVAMIGDRDPDRDGDKRVFLITALALCALLGLLLWVMATVEHYPQILKAPL